MQSPDFGRRSQQEFLRGRAAFRLWNRLIQKQPKKSEVSSIYPYPCYCFLSFLINLYLYQNPLSAFAPKLANPRLCKSSQPAFAPKLANPRLRALCPISSDVCSLIDARKTNACFAVACFSFASIILYVLVKHNLLQMERTSCRISV